MSCITNPLKVVVNYCEGLVNVLLIFVVAFDLHCFHDPLSQVHLVSTETCSGLYKRKLYEEHHIMVPSACNWFSCLASNA